MTMQYSQSNAARRAKLDNLRILAAVLRSREFDAEINHADGMLEKVGG